MTLVPLAWPDRENGLGDDGDARVVPERGGDLERRFESREMVVAEVAAAVIDHAGAACPRAVTALQRLQLHLCFFARPHGLRLALHAHPGTTQRRQAALLQFFIGEAAGGGIGGDGDFLRPEPAAGRFLPRVPLQAASWARSRGSAPARVCPDGASSSLASVRCRDRAPMPVDLPGQSAAFAPAACRWTAFEPNRLPSLLPAPKECTAHRYTR